MEDPRRFGRPVDMRERKNDFLDLHPVSVVGSLMGGRGPQGPAAQDAESETWEPRERLHRRLLAAYRRRVATARAETGTAQS
jgi:hypothetical protein